MYSGYARGIERTEQKQECLGKKKKGPIPNLKCSSMNSSWGYRPLHKDIIGSPSIFVCEALPC